MVIRTVAGVLVFWSMQVIAQVLFKWGSASPSRWLWGFAGGNLFGLSSIWLLMVMYRHMNPNLALGIGVGGAFLFSQITLAIVFRSRVAPLQWVGIAAIVAGMFALAVGPLGKSS